MSQNQKEIRIACNVEQANEDVHSVCHTLLQHALQGDVISINNNIPLLRQTLSQIDTLYRIRAEMENTLYFLQYPNIARETAECKRESESKSGKE
jgi:hypothetical protein